MIKERAMPAGEAVITDTPADPESNLVAHARRELERIGEEPDTIDWYLSVVHAFIAFGHSGGSAAVMLPVLERLLRFKPLSELTDDPAEWLDVSGVSGRPWWQNVRDSRAMSHDGGITYWMVHEADAAGGSDAAPVHRSTPALELSGATPESPG
jgi:hypothetical protein